jgi:transposase
VQERLCYPPEAAPRQPVASRWNLSRIREHVACYKRMSLSGVWKALRRAGIGWRAGRGQMYSPDPAYAQKVSRLLAALSEARHSPHSVVVLFLDEMTYCRWADAAHDWCESAPAPIPLAKHSGKYERQRILGALNAHTGRLTYDDQKHWGGSEVSDFLRQLTRRYLRARTIYVVWDNWPPHLSKEVQRVFAEQPRLQAISLPTYAPWLNPIEKLWRWFRQQVDYLHRHAGDWPLHQEHVHQFFEQFTRPSPSLLRYVGLAGKGLLASAGRDP